MVSIYGTFLAIVIPGAISSMLWIELARSESLLARTKSIKRPAWRLASLYKPFGCTVQKLGQNTSKKLRIGSARPKSVVGMELGQPAVASTPVLGAIWPHSRVWSTHMIAFAMGNLWDMFGSERTRFRIKSACWLCKGHTQSKPSEWEGWSFPRHCQNCLQSLRYPRDRLHNAQLWK